MPLDPELQRLDDFYNRLFTDLKAGRIGQTDAISSLERMTVSDGSGNLWGLQPDGEFYCQAPGGRRVVADPAQFVPIAAPQTQLAPPPGTVPWPTGSPTPWAEPTAHGLASPWDPAVPPPPQPPAEGWGSPPNPWDPTTTPAELPGVPPPPWSQQTVEPRRGRSAPPEHHQMPGWPGAGNGRSDSHASSPVVAFVRDHKKGVAIGVVVLVIVVLSVIASHNHQKTSPEHHHSRTASTAPFNGASSSTTAPPATSAAPTIPPNATLSDADFTTVVHDLESGSPQTAASIIASPGSPATQMVDSAPFYGYAHEGLTIAADAATTSSGKVTQVWQLLSPTQQIYAKTTVTWTYTDGHWLLAAWPSFR